MDASIKENKSKKTLGTKHPGNHGHHEKTQSINNRSRGKRRDLGQRQRKHFQQNHKRKIP